MSQEPEEASALRPSSHVRFSRAEYAQIQEDSVNTGQSIPTLLKERYFKGPRPLPLLARADMEKLFGELGRIGNNVNQIARRVNSGIRAGFAGEFEEVQRSLTQLWLFLSSKRFRSELAPQG
jgi:hypothetical protein